MIRIPRSESVTAASAKLPSAMPFSVVTLTAPEFLRPMMAMKTRTRLQQSKLPKTITGKKTTAKTTIRVLETSRRPVAARKTTTIPAVAATTTAAVTETATETAIAAEVLAKA